LGKNVPEDEYATAVIGPVISLFASPDRGVRMALLDTLDDYKDKLDKKMVVDKIWPHLVLVNFISYRFGILNYFQQTGFTDTVAIVREATVRCISSLADKVRIRNFFILLY
jgi:SCY1-like protein 1